MTILIINDYIQSLCSCFTKVLNKFFYHRDYAIFSKILLVLLLYLGLVINLKSLAISNNYKIDVVISSEQRSIQGSEELTVYNNSKESTDKIYLFLGLNNSYDTQMQVNEVSNADNLVLPGTIYKYKYLGQEIQDKNIYQISLPTPISPNEAVILKVKFEVSNLSKINNIIFLDDSINDIYSASWYPRIINFDNGVWKKRDFQASNYEVVATIETDDNIASSAIEISNENLKSKGLKKITYKLDNARSFSLALSNYISSETDQTKDGTIVKVFYLNNKSGKWTKSIISATKDVIDFYYKKFGLYPYKQISILPGNPSLKGGYADSNLIVIHDSYEKYKYYPEFEPDLKWLLAYYMAQQYFGYYVGESGEYPRWVTSGISLFLAQNYLKEKNLINPSYNNYIKQYINAAKSGFNTQVLQTIDELRQSNFDWENIIEKGKSAQVFKMLEYSIGRKTIQDTLKKILTKYQNTIINTEKFQSVLEDESGKKLDLFFKQWIKENKKLDYAVTKIKQEKVAEKYEAKITLKRLGKVIMPVSVVAVLKNGSRVIKSWDGEKSEIELVFEYEDQIKYVQIDPAGILPDIDLSNNKLDANGL